MANCIRLIIKGIEYKLQGTDSSLNTSEESTPVDENDIKIVKDFIRNGTIPNGFSISV
jgi:hypothetical protein